MKNISFENVLLYGMIISFVILILGIIQESSKKENKKN